MQSLKVKIVSPNWGHTWLKIFPELLAKRGHVVVKEAPDVTLDMWANGEGLILCPNAKHIMYMRRYEYFAGNWRKFDWSKIDHLIFVNAWIKEQVEREFKTNGVKTQTHLIYNAVDPSAWTYKERTHGKKIGMACTIHPKKNIPLALQILAELPEDYELHIAGEIQDECLYRYIDHISQSTKRRVYLYGKVPHEHMDRWWEDMNYCLSTSISEGNPNNVLEAMAKGIKPVVHNWPGAIQQFGAFNCFNDIYQAVGMIDPNRADDGGMGEFDYHPRHIRDYVERIFGLANYEKVIDIIESVQVVNA